jgi:glycosyltransferase involved in cell wall biosynthesis
MEKVAIVAIIGDMSSGATRGVHDKVCAQGEAISNLGYETRSFFGVSGALCENLEDTKQRKFIHYDTSASKLSRKSLIFSNIFMELEKFEPDILYFRYPLADYALNNFLKTLRSRFPDLIIATERQTKELPELLARKSASNLVKFTFELMFRKAVQRKIDFNIGVTQEICSYISGYYPKSRCITCGNGIPADQISNYAVPVDNDTGAISLIFVGNITPWCGLDQLVQQLSKINFKYGDDDIFLDIVGDGVALPQLKKAVGEDFPNVIFHGFQKGQDLDTLLSRSNFAIGALNNQKRLLKEGSNLKLRLYCAKGIPFLLGEFDTDFSMSDKAGVFFVEKRSGTDFGSADLENVLQFAKSCSTQRELRNDMISFARSNLTWDVKLAKVFAQLSNICRT